MTLTRNTSQSSLILIVTLLTMLLGITSASASHSKVKRISVTPVGSITIFNPTAFQYNILLDGRNMASIEPQGTLLLDNAPAGKHVVTAVYPGKLYLPPQKMRATLRSGSDLRLQLKQPMGKIRVKNRQGVKATLMIDGKKRAVLKPGANLLIPELRVGKHNFKLVGPFGTIAQKSLFIQARNSAVWSPKVRVGTLRIRNHDSSEAVTVRIDGQMAGVVASGRALTIKGVLPGWRRVEILSRHKRPVTRDFHVHAAETTAWFYSPKPSTVATTYGMFSSY